MKIHVTWSSFYVFMENENLFKKVIALAAKVRSNCCLGRYDDFLLSLRDLLRCGMKMNPARSMAEV